MSSTDDARLTTDEDIIELTDIIEKGAAAKASPDSGAESFEKELEDLFSDGGGLESMKGFDVADADAAQHATATDPFSPASPPSAQPAHDADMDMSIDADIDALLNSIGDLPDTPEPSATASSASPATSASSAAAPAARMAPPPVTADEEEAFDMPSGTASDTPSAITGRPVDPDEQLTMPDMTDMDALLGNIGAPSMAEIAQSRSGVSSGSDDIDDLITGLGTKQPAGAAQATGTAESEADAFEAALAASMAREVMAADNAPGAAPQPQAADASPGKSSEPMDITDLDALLEDMLGPSGKGAAAAMPEEPAQPEIELPAEPSADADPFEAALAASAAQPVAAKPAEPPADADPFEAALAAAAATAPPARKASPAAPEPPLAPADADEPPAEPTFAPAPEAPATAHAVPEATAPEDSPAGLAARVEALEASLTELAERGSAERAEREALETRLSAMESMADATPALSEDALAELLAPLLLQEDGPFAPLVDRVREALAADVEARIEAQLAPLRARLDAAEAAAPAGQEDAVTHADLDMLAADLRASLHAEVDSAAAAAAARIIREEIAALAEAL